MIWVKIFIEYIIVFSYIFAESSYVPYLVSVSKSVIFIVWGFTQPNFD